ncbi:uncharacterized protein LOC123871266 [Maniola jurtina]|uniref:uncharacterized protein LOC123871266 n=1 Tax=Maniola jurtina TaxID=191418 RepID=UPI001E68FBB7|nr:uncharacterized protein LOC123871266 [Maniola jurtina]
MMFRLLVLCAILTFVEPYTSQCRTQPPFYGDRCPGVTETNLESMLDSIERVVIEQEERLMQFCYQNWPMKTGQIFKNDSFYLIYNLTEPRDSRITVRIKHRYLHITATEKYGNQEIIFQDMKVLPDIVNTDYAQWTYKNGETLTIRIPYRVFLEELTQFCPLVTKYVIDVPYVPESEFNYSLQDWTQNGYNFPPGHPSGSNYGSQGGSQYGHNVPPGRPFGPNYGSPGWSQNGFNVPAGRPSGPNYGSQNSIQNGPADPSSGFTYRG